MEQMTLEAQPRQREHKGDNKALRRTGRVPAVIYGGDNEPLSVSLDDHQLELILHGGRRSNSIFNLNVGEGQEQTLIREVQRHPVHNRIIHIDFLRVNLQQDIEVEVPVHAIGDPLGVRNGGVLEHVNRTVRVSCRPLNIPRELVADLTNLDMNQTFHVSQLTLPEGVVFVDEPETALFTVLPPRTEEAPAAAVTEAVQPEVIVKKREVSED